MKRTHKQAYTDTLGDLTEACKTLEIPNNATQDLENVPAHTKRFVINKVVYNPSCDRSKLLYFVGHR